MHCMSHRPPAGDVQCMYHKPRSGRQALLHSVSCFGTMQVSLATRAQVWFESVPLFTRQAGSLLVSVTSLPAS